MLGTGYYCGATGVVSHSAYPYSCSCLPVDYVNNSWWPLPSAGSRLSQALKCNLERPVLPLVQFSSCHEALLGHPWTASRYASRRRRMLDARAALPLELELSFLELSPATVFVSSALIFAVMRAIVYFRMQYIIASMLARNVPRGGAKVLDLSLHEGRNLHYYPSDIVGVLAAGSNSNAQLLENQAIKAGVSLEIKSRDLDALGLPSNSVDAVISVYCICDLPDDKVVNVLHEAVRVLRPGKPLIFVENIQAHSSIVRFAQGVWESFSKLLGYRGTFTRDTLHYIQETRGLEKLEYEEVLMFQDPHLVGIAVKKVPDQTQLNTNRGFKSK